MAVKVDFLDFIFKKRQKVKSDFFGTMTATKFKKGQNTSYFECRRYFKPTQKIIELVIECEKSGETEKQITFFKWIEDNYPEICKSVTPLIECLYEYLKSGKKIVDFPKELEVRQLFLPQCDSVPVEWDILFETRLDSQKHYFRLVMKGLEAVGIGMES